MINDDYFFIANNDLKLTNFGFSNVEIIKAKQLEREKTFDKMSLTKKPNLPLQFFGKKMEKGNFLSSTMVSLYQINLGLIKILRRS